LTQKAEEGEKESDLESLAFETQRSTQGAELRQKLESDRGFCSTDVWKRSVDPFQHALDLV
jgi:hypothetical protein